VVVQALQAQHAPSIPIRSKDSDERTSALADIVNGAEKYDLRDFGK
tara:strand:+ start:1372 stop:1509 length:138 start_codon:yes stop_codon:yes gene_type:complete